MNTLLPYVIKSAACLGILYIFYRAFLSRDTFFGLNRFFLLFAGVISLLIPVIPFDRILKQPVNTVAVFLDTVTVGPGGGEKFQQQVSGGPGILTLVYLAGAAVVLGMFLVRIIQMMLLVRRSSPGKGRGYRLMFFNRDISPFSFFNMIFLSSRMAEHDDLQTILAHERVHIRQAHSLDLVLAEILVVVQWFNPFAWLIRQELRNIHEYLADDGVISNGTPIPEYQQLVLDETMGIQVNRLANNFKISQVKNRIIMMTKKRSGYWSRGKALLALPVLVAAGLVFSAHSANLNIPKENAKAQTIKNDIFLSTPDTVKKEVKKEAAPVKKEPAKTQEIHFTPMTPDEQPTYPGGDEARVKFLMENVKYPATALKDTLQGKVIVSFIVQKDGSITDVKVVRSVRKDLDEEAIRVVKLMPKWNPGKLKGEVIICAMNLPINFKLDGKKK
jgi:TonB family protein